MKMKLKINFLFISLFLMNCAGARKVPAAGGRTYGQTAPGRVLKQNAEQSRQSDYVTRPASYFISQDNQNQLVRQLIDELIKNLHNKTLINRIRDLDEKNDQQLIRNLTGNLEGKDPLMSEYLDQKLKNYLTKVQQQSLNQTVDLMEILKQVLIFLFIILVFSVFHSVDLFVDLCFTRVDLLNLELKNLTKNLPQIAILQAVQRHRLHIDEFQSDE